MDDLTEQLRASGSVFAEDEAKVLSESASSQAELEAMAQRRISGEPIQQIVGWAEFCGLRIRVAPGVFLPRHRSEYMVEKAIGSGQRGMRILDICCGTGAIGVATTVGLGGADLHATDIDPDAARCAALNVDELHGRVYVGDLFDPLPTSLMGTFDLILANAPYVPSGEIHLMPREARLHEHQATLDGGDDGLDIQRRLIATAPDWLAPDGRVLVETSDRQVEGTMQLMRSAGLRTTLSTSAELDANVVSGRRDTE